jgi:hypothetical protein
MSEPVLKGVMMRLSGPANFTLLDAQHALALVRMDEIEREFSRMHLARRAARGRPEGPTGSGLIARVLDSWRFLRRPRSAPAPVRAGP